MSEPKWQGRRKRRPRQHVIADMGLNFLERQVLRRGHQLRRVPEPEYGTDALMMHFSPVTQEIENGWVEFQVKATDNLRMIDRGRAVACIVEAAHARFWYWELPHPFILVLYDAAKHRAFWVNIQDYLDEHGIGDSRTVTVRIPTQNKLTVAAVDRFRRISLEQSRRPTREG